MMRFLVILFLSLLMISCENEDRKDLLNQQDETEKVPDTIQTLEGEFIYVSNDAVFRGKDFVYGVTIDSMAQVLADTVQPYKSEDFDMISVRIKGKISPNPRNEGWNETIEIREIIDILETKEVPENQEE